MPYATHPIRSNRAAKAPASLPMNRTLRSVAKLQNCRLGSRIRVAYACSDGRQGAAEVAQEKQKPRMGLRAEAESKRPAPARRRDAVRSGGAG